MVRDMQLEKKLSHSLEHVTKKLHSKFEFYLGMQVKGHAV